MSRTPDILFQDQRFVVLNKPAGLPVHPGPRSCESVEDMFPALSRRRDGPWLAHRLDADTSGCLVIALRRAALLAAQAEFAAGRAHKVYWAVVQGQPAEPAGLIKAPLLKSGPPHDWRMRVDPKGLPASTEWRVLARLDGTCLLELRPRTGRTHQVRVHCAHLGHAILGDPVYGDGAGRLQLLARSIELDLALRLSATAPPPEHMRALLPPAFMEKAPCPR